MSESTHNTLTGIRQEALVHLSDSEKLLSEYSRYAETLEDMIDKQSLNLTDDTMESYENLKKEFEIVQDKIRKETEWFDALYTLTDSLNKQDQLTDKELEEAISHYQSLINQKISHI